MVERPIKKSERQAMAESSTAEEVVETQPTFEGVQPSEEREKPRPRLDKDKGKGKDKDKDRGRGGKPKDDRESKSPTNLALMRGPKPTKPKPPVVQEDQEETAENSDETTAESEET